MLERLVEKTDFLGKNSFPAARDSGAKLRLLLGFYETKKIDSWSAPTVVCSFPGCNCPGLKSPFIDWDLGSTSPAETQGLETSLCEVCHGFCQ